MGVELYSVMGITQWVVLWVSHSGWCCGRHTMGGVVGIAPQVVLWVLHCRWCHRRCTICGVVGIPPHGIMGIPPHVVSWASYHVWCCRHPTMCGVAGIPPRSVAGIVHGAMGVAPHVVSWSWSLCRMVLWSCGGYCCTVWCHSRNHHYRGHCGWWLGCGRPWKERTATCLLARRVVGERGDWTAKEEISRKKKKKKKDI